MKLIQFIVIKSPDFCMYPWALKQIYREHRSKVITPSTPYYRHWHRIEAEIQAKQLAFHFINLLESILSTKKIADKSRAISAEDI